MGMEQGSHCKPPDGSQHKSEGKRHSLRRVDSRTRRAICRAQSLPRKINAAARLEAEQYCGLDGNCSPAIVHTCKFEGLHMRTIAVTINKGGQGKTTLTRSVSTAAVLAGMNVLVLDMDTQQNATSWGKRRSHQYQKPLPLVRFTTEHDLSEELQRAKTAGCDLVFIDTPPGRNSEAPAAVESADLVLIPFWNDQDSYDGVVKTAGLTRRIGKPAFGVLN